jgi:hypothetical protein
MENLKRKSPSKELQADPAKRVGIGQQEERIKPTKR